MVIVAIAAVVAADGVCRWFVASDNLSASQTWGDHGTFTADWTA